MAPLSPLALLLASGLAYHGHRKKSLSPSGSMAAFVVGYLMLSSTIWAFGVSLIAFYLIGSRATKFGKATKRRFESAYHEYGYRTGWQVISNSFSALVALPGWVLGSLLRSPEFTTHPALVHAPPYTSPAHPEPRWCPGTPYPAPTGPTILKYPRSFPPTLSRPLILLALGHFACCLGDTLASELGILAKGKPMLLIGLKANLPETTGISSSSSSSSPASSASAKPGFLSRLSFLTPVPPGTNGALSFPGTAASLAGGAIMGFVMGVVLILENGVCRRDAFGVVVELITIGGLCGFGGSLVDSILGATLQETRYDPDRKVVISDGEGQAEVSG
ncbi:hypothetical protein K525DRAFT_368036 [Schizophyllum commune Loenen D]|nr:hypothetical protein K525DRAFT_368036 [Schizophyllum commune Loenen D]